MIIFLNCSYKAKDSNSKYFLEFLQDELDDKAYEMLDMRVVMTQDVELFVDKLRSADTLVLGVPLYVDCLPAQVVKLFEDLLDRWQGQFLDLGVYVVSNLGFYESEQIRHLLDIVRNWCMRMGVRYGGGLAIGAGPMVRTVGAGKKLKAEMKSMANAIRERESWGNHFCNSEIPRAVYVKAAHMSFRKTAKKNHLDPKSII